MQLVTKICILSSRRVSSSDFLLTAVQAAAGTTPRPVPPLEVLILSSDVSLNSGECELPKPTRATLTVGTLTISNFMLCK